jgi:DNA polymerase-1
LSVERVQLQAIPHAHQTPPGVPTIRTFFRAKPGHGLYELDISQAEVRVAASVARCQGMYDVLTGDSPDVHGSTATRVFGVKPGDEDWEQLRSVAKRLTFGILYGAGVRTLRDQIKLFTGIDYSESDTRAMIDQYDDAFPELRRASRRAQRKADRGMGGVGYVELKVSGRRRYFGYGERSHKAFNAVIQGTVAELVKMWMLKVEQAHPGMMLLQIHDSVVLEVPVSQRDEVVHSAGSIMQGMFEQRLVDIGGLRVPFDYDWKQW